MQGRSISLAALAIVASALLAAGCKRCMLVPWSLEVDPTLTGNSDADGVLEPFETVVVEPTWENKVTYSTGACGGKVCVFGKPVPGDFDCTHGVTESGAPVSVTGPTGGDYVVQDSPSPYGSFGYNNTKSGAYAIFVSASTRPAAHWDATFTENLTGTNSQTKSWTLHIGDSFWDVPRTSPFYKKVETLFHSGVTAGCAPGAFCPDAILSRSDIAVFTARGLAKGGANIPASGVVGTRSYNCASGGESLFFDVHPTDPYCKHFHYLVAQDVMPPCGGAYECPSQPVPRDQMAGIVARAMVAPSGVAAVPLTYGPDPVTGLSYSCNPASPAIHFTDVGASSPSCRLVHFLWARGVIAGCGPDTFCPRGDITRGEMAKFLANAFDLKLYGP